VLDQARSKVMAQIVPAEIADPGLVLSWYAPALTSAREAAVRDWSDTEIVRLLKVGQIQTATGTSRHASTMASMGEVVYKSLQYAHDEDLRAIAIY